MIAGYVVKYDQASGVYIIRTRNKNEIAIHLREGTYAKELQNLNEPYKDCTNNISTRLVPGQYVFSYCLFYPTKRNLNIIEAQFLIFVMTKEAKYIFEDKDWWPKQAAAISDFYIKSQFKGEEINFNRYVTYLDISGNRLPNDSRQESAVLSRLIYGFATTYMLTGDEIYLDVARKGCRYLQENMRIVDKEKDMVYWYHALAGEGNQKEKILASSFSDDANSIPLYEQIYVLSGLAQTFRLTGDKSLLEDINKTIKFFDLCYRDDEHKGYFSHIDAETLSPLSARLEDNKAKKNWNSNGDHQPAYLINMWLATEDKKYKDMLFMLSDLLIKYFPQASNDFIQERFNQDWSPDTTYKWQQNRAVIGHNLKIMWNLQRIENMSNRRKYKKIINKIAKTMPRVGLDLCRGGWYDVIERTKGDDAYFRFSFHDRKAWWQQEQGILAYLITQEMECNSTFLEIARESQAFYNAFFLDHDHGGIYFGVLANGIPYLKDIEALKGSHAMGGYHSIELAFLAHVYTQLFVKKQSIFLYFLVDEENSFKKKLFVAPDAFPKNCIYLKKAWINNEEHMDIDAKNLIVYLPEREGKLKVKIELSGEN